MDRISRLSRTVTGLAITCVVLGLYVIASSIALYSMHERVVELESWVDNQPIVKTGHNWGSYRQAGVENQTDYWREGHPTQRFYPPNHPKAVPPGTNEYEYGGSIPREMDWNCTGYSRTPRPC